MFRNSLKWQVFRVIKDEALNWRLANGKENAFKQYQRTDNSGDC